MKKISEVSIANMAFSIEKEAYIRLEAYLSSLRNHYSGDNAGGEIIEGIEERISELFTEKLKGLEVVSLSMVEETIAILGEPECFENDSEQKVRRKFYRNMDNSILGGVCSGLAAYFEREPLLFRVIALVLCLVFGGINVVCHINIAWVVIIAYILTWIIVPAAKTVEQKCRMNGYKNSIEGIESAIQSGATSLKNGNYPSKIWKILCNIIGIILLILGIVYLVAVLLSFWGIRLENVYLIDMINYFFLQVVSGYGSFSSIFFKIVLAIAVFFPAIGMIYGGLQMLFKFKVPKWKPGLLIFLLWFVSFLIVIGMAATMLTFLKSNREVASKELSFPSDTLYVRFSDVKKYEDCKVDIDASFSYFSVDYVDQREDVTKLVKYPVIRKYEGDSSSIQIRSTKLDKSKTMREIRELKKVTGYTLEGNVLTLDPIIFGEDMPLTEYHKLVTIEAKEGAVVIIEEPMHHTFDRRIDYSNIDGILF